MGVLVPCRFAAVVELEMALTGNPDKKMLMRALARRRHNQFDNFFDRLITELFITGICFSSQDAHLLWGHTFTD